MLNILPRKLALFLTSNRRQDMSKISRLKKSRNKWKNKAGDRSAENLALRKEKNRLTQALDKYKNRLREAKNKVKELESQLSRPFLWSKVVLVFIALLLFGVARLGFRAVSRTLGVLGGFLGLDKAPCAQTVINWVSRLAIARIQNVGNLLKASAGPGFIWIIDASIALGSGKILAVLAVRIEHHSTSEKAITLQDTHCVAVSVAATWTGESIADFLHKAIEAAGCPAAFLKDGGRDIAKAVTILDEKGYAAPCIDDVSHVAANLLKREYGNHPLFETFISACGRVSKKLKQTILACLAPPKVSTKARFMNLHRLVTWADRLLRHSPVGRAAKGSLIERLRRGLDQLPACKPFIRRFLRDASALLRIQGILKNRGLSRQTALECEVMLDELPALSPVRIGMADWVNRHLAVAETLGLERAGMPISTDSIESLFGVSKTLGVGSVKDANRIAARIPALCGVITPADAQAVLDVSVKEQNEALGDLASLVKQRRQIQSNPGSLEEVLADADSRNLTLLPGTKTGEKDVINTNKSDSYEKIRGPDIQRRIAAVFQPDPDISGISAYC